MDSETNSIILEVLENPTEENLQKLLQIWHNIYRKSYRDESLHYTLDCILVSNLERSQLRFVEACERYNRCRAHAR